MRLRRSIGLALLALPAGAFLATGTAEAAAPAYPATFGGPSAHGYYAITIDTGCNGGSGNTTDCPITAGYIDMTVTTSKAFGKCPGNTQFSFPTPTLKKDGSFSATQAYGGGRTMTVNGRFTSARSAHGTISGNEGCTAAGFTVTLPKPIVPVVPPGATLCYYLDKAHATQTLGGAAKPVGVAEATYSVLTGLGRCAEWTKKRAITYYGARAYTIIISQDSPDLSRGFPKKVAGLGPGAMSAPDFYGNTIYFKSGAAWVTLYFSIASAKQPPKSAVTAQGKALLVVAHRIYALIH